MKSKFPFSRSIVFVVWFFFLSGNSHAQDQFPWPVTPFNASHWITGNFCEYRSTTNPAHFHNGTDIPSPDGSPVYPVKDGIIISMERQGDNAYVRVDDKAYVHILPEPTLSVGDPVFASQTVLGTILPGMGHVHFTNGYVGSERNSMLMGSGLTPLDDPWPPIIRFVSFYQNNTTTQFAANQVSGRVDIVVKVDEQNGPPGSATSVLNNGTYKIGYKIYNADTSTVVYSPPNNGLRFQFDTKPSNSYVDIVFFRTLSSTTSHVYQVTNEVSNDNYWDTSLLPEGDYVVMVFTEDTRQNTDTAYVRVTVEAVDTTPPQQPAFRYALGTDSDIRLAWFPNSDPDLAGYRLFFSFDNVNWSLFKDESVFTPAVTDTILPQVINTDIYFQLTAVDNSPLKNESLPSDVYGLSNGTVYNGKVLLVDGFDRSDGAWTQPYHDFAYTYGQAIVENGFSFDTVPNESIEDSTIDLNDYDAVIWLLGDESIATETFSAAEQALIKSYLENGGNLFVSGSHVAWDLDADGAGVATPEDEEFLHNYLKTDYAGKETGINSAAGSDSSVFSGLAFTFGQIPYGVDSADVLIPFGSNAITCLAYNDSLGAAVQYRGVFGNGTSPGSVIYSAIPFETITDPQVRSDFMGRVLSYFSAVTSIDTKQESGTVPAQFALHPNYPNPFNPATVLEYDLPVASTVELVVYNLLGQRIRTLEKARKAAGRHVVRWDGRNESGQPVASGIYLVRFLAREANSVQKFEKSIRVLLTK